MCGATLLVRCGRSTEHDETAPGRNAGPRTTAALGWKNASPCGAAPRANAATSAPLLHIIVASVGRGPLQFLAWRPQFASPSPYSTHLRESGCVLDEVIPLINY